MTVPPRIRAAGPGGLLGAAVVLASLLTACGGETVTFNRDVAPIVFEHCAPCHHPGGVAPFSLLEYERAAERAQQIAVVTETGFMPPWLPEPGRGDFADERRLSALEIATLARWQEAGAPEGDARDLPPVPEFPDGWQLGEPDHVVEMEEPYLLPAEGPDVFRNFVIPAGVTGARWVRAVEFRPADPRLVHHAILQVDRTQASRQLDQDDPGPGFSGMYMGPSYTPDGQFLGWTPGKVPSPGRGDRAWSVDERTDFVLQLHMPPTGKPEAVRVSLGLHFAEQPPTLRPFALMLSSEDIDIPAGAKDYRVEDRFVLPTDVDVLGLYPHAHYLGQEIEAWAELPDGERRWLLHIRDWDFNWQDDYRYKTPLALPRGTTLRMRFGYDNSAENFQNPHSPPRRVRYGYQSSDEMANLLLEVVPKDEGARRSLELASLEARLARNPGSWRVRNELGHYLVTEGQLEEAVRYYREALEIRPREPELLFHLGTTLATLGRRDEALPHLLETVRLVPGHSDAHNNLGITYQEMGRLDDAIRHHRRALESDPSFAQAHHNLGVALERRGERSEAIAAYRAALANAPENDQIRDRLALALLEAGKTAQQAGDYSGAERLYRETVELRGDDLRPRYNLGVVLVLSGKAEEALPHFRNALTAGPEYLAPLTRMAWTLATHPSEEVREPRWALPIAELLAELTERKNPVVLDTLAAARAASGDSQGALRDAEEALALASSEDGQEAFAEQIRRRIAIYRQAEPPFGASVERIR